MNHCCEIPNREHYHCRVCNYVILAGEKVAAIMPRLQVFIPGEADKPLDVIYLCPQHAPDESMVQYKKNTEGYWDVDGWWNLGIFVRFMER